MEALGRMAAIILAVILLILFPIRYEAQKTDLSVNSYIDTEMDHFFHMVNTRGEITQEMYYEFIDQLSAIGESYQVEIEIYSEIIYSEDDENLYLDYKYVRNEIKTHDCVILNCNDHLLIRVQKMKDTTVDRLKNLFLPSSYRQSVYVIGGCID